MQFFCPTEGKCKRSSFFSFNRNSTTSYILVDKNLLQRHHDQCKVHVRSIRFGKWLSINFSNMCANKCNCALSGYSRINLRLLMSLVALLGASSPPRGWTRQTHLPSPLSLLPPPPPQQITTSNKHSLCSLVEQDSIKLSAMMYSAVWCTSLISIIHSISHHLHPSHICSLPSVMSVCW